MNSYPPGFLREVKLGGPLGADDDRPRRLGWALSFASRIVRLSFDGTSPRTNNR